MDDVDPLTDLACSIERQSKELHAEVAQRVEQSGRFWMSTTELKGKSYFRINPVNFRTRKKHMEELFRLLQQECLAINRKLAKDI